MIERDKTFKVNEYPIPDTTNKFTLELDPERIVLGVVDNNGEQVLLVEESSDTDKRKSEFVVVASYEQTTLPSDYSHLGMFVRFGKIRHIYGVRAGARLGGAAGGF